MIRDAASKSPRGVTARPIVVRCGGALVLSGVLLSGCSGTADADARAATERFYAAIAGSDGAGACAVLSPRTRQELESSAGTPCAQAVLEEDVPASRDRPEVSVYGDAARAVVGSDIAFLARHPDGWRVIAAGCRPALLPDVPDDCLVQGG